MDFYNRKLFLPIISPATSIHCGIKCIPTPSPSPQPSTASVPAASNPVPVNPFVSLYYANHAEQIHLLRVVMIAVSSVLGLILLLFTILKILGSYYSRRFHERRLNSPILFDIQGEPPFSDEETPAINHPIWFINTVGLQQSVIDSIAVCKYRENEGLVEVTECSVCLGEFQEDENLRLLPKCTHAFHVSCIDTWLRSHKNCPLCRAPVVREASGGGEAVSVVAPIDSNSSVENRTAEVSDGAVVGDYYPTGEGESSEVRVGDNEDSGIMIMTSEDGEGSEVLDDKNLVNSDKLNCNSSARVLSRSDSVCSSC